jgi:hypothetical protein
MDWGVVALWRRRNAILKTIVPVVTNSSGALQPRECRARFELRALLLLMIRHTEGSHEEALRTKVVAN